MKVLSVGGLPVQVFGLDAVSPPSPHGLAVLFLCHGRFGCAADPKIAAFATSLVTHARAELAKAPGKDLLVVTFDQRNHGQRVVDQTRNKSWRDHGEVAELENVSHATDMYSIQSECSLSRQAWEGTDPACALQPERLVTARSSSTSSLRPSSQTTKG